ncbi:MAG: hydantoinase/oxoprolinase family protein [Candidatus Tectomicrobia bacterium]|nr:hydantoinase/oxoprolinase family protein [Candidatus Tectomicrobia bacterium]
MSLRISVDTGGTFTDFVCLDDSGEAQVTKILSLPENPAAAVFAGLRQIAAARGLPLSELLASTTNLFFGTTLGTNAVLTGTGARLGLLTTKGFRDLLEMRRGTRDHLYDNKTPPPSPLVPRYLRLPITERVDAAGEVIIPLRAEDVAQACATLRREEAEAVAVAFLHAYCNPKHEREAAALLARLWPQAFLSLSSEVAPAIGIYERTSTTVLNAYCGPLMQRFVGRLQEELRGAGFGGSALVMQSNGGMISPADAGRFAARTILSGPAAGAMAGRALARQTGIDTCITLDMGGTSTDVCLIEAGEPIVTTEARLGAGRYRLNLPTLDIHTIGAGGGSIAWLDRGGLLHVGPQSAGAQPGPACYGRGGRRPTVTDANVLLGCIAPERFFGGRMQLDSQAARRAIEEEVAGALGLDAAAAAFGIITVVNTNMAAAVREVSLDRGYDPRDFALVVGGGAGPLHACAVAREIGIPRIVVPRDASAFSAHGMLATDLRHDFVATFTGPLDGSSAKALPQTFAELRRQAHAQLEADGVPESGRQLVPSLDLRYKGQYHELTVPLAAGDAESGAFPATAGAFHSRHEQRYGYAVKEDAIEIVNLRLLAIGCLPKTAAPAKAARAPSTLASPSGMRAVYLDRRGGFREVPLYDGALLHPGFTANGPALIAQPFTTILVAVDYTVQVDPYGNYLLWR